MSLVRERLLPVFPKLIHPVSGAGDQDIQKPPGSEESPCCQPQGISPAFQPPRAWTQNVSNPQMCLP